MHPIAAPSIIRPAWAVRELVAIEQALAAADTNLVRLVTDGPLAEGTHYPAGEVWDPSTHAQFFFHAHRRAAADPAEAGHFHCFLGAGAMPPGMTPLMLPEMAMAPPPAREVVAADPGTHRSGRDRGVFTHLIAVSVDGAGRPLGLFTTNRWVTGETWYRAEDLIHLTDRFRFVEDPEAGPVVELAGRWLAAVVALLQPEIAGLLLERDRVVMDWRRRRARQTHVFEDRRLEVTSSQSLSLSPLLGGQGEP